LNIFKVVSNKKLFQGTSSPAYWLKLLPITLLIHKLLMTVLQLSILLTILALAMLV
jgi:hypothetical protein